MFTEPTNGSAVIEILGAVAGKSAAETFAGTSISTIEVDGEMTPIDGSPSASGGVSSSVSPDEYWNR